MLGCVVSLTSSHLSGSTIRDVNTVGSVLCSNSSFSSLLSSSNAVTDSSTGTVTRPGQDPEPFIDGTNYFFNETSSVDPTTVFFSHCHFSGSKYPSARPLTLLEISGNISIISCSFKDITYTGEYSSTTANAGLTGGALYVNIVDTFYSTSFAVTSSNFTNCSSILLAGAMFVQVQDGALINSCRFESCSTTARYSDDDAEGGGLSLCGWYRDDQHDGVKLELVDCIIADCTAVRVGAGLYAAGVIEISVVDSKFERCELIDGNSFGLGGGIGVSENAPLTVERSHFIGCSSRNGGAAIGTTYQKSIHVSDSLVKNCHSAGTNRTTGAICLIRFLDSESCSFSHVLFDSNSVGDDTHFFTWGVGLEKTSPKFPDVAIISMYCYVFPTLKFEDCFTTNSTESSGMIISKEYIQSAGVFSAERILDPAFETFGPLLTAKPRARVNEETGKIKLEMEGKTPLPSQEYEVTLKEDETGTVTRLRMLFSDGTGTLVSGSESNLQYNTNYTITSIVGVVPPSSSSRLTNGIEVPVATWAFNLAVTPSFITFITPKAQSFSTLQDATAHLIESDPQFAFVILHFDKDVSGSYDFVVLEDGEEVTLTITTESGSKSGATKEFKVIGKGKLLTHNTTYTIKSIDPTPNTDSPTDVRMNDTITFHIPQSPSNEKSQLPPETKKLLSWLIPLSACLLVALILAIIIIVLLRRQQKKHAELTQKDVEDVDQVELDEKMDVFGDDPTKNGLNSDGRGHSTFGSSSVLPPTVNPLGQEGKSMSMTKDGLVEVMACSGGFEGSVVGNYTTLYDVLHKEKREVGKRALGLQIVNGLKAVLGNRPGSDVVTRLSSHWILIDTFGNVQLKLQMDPSEAEHEAAHPIQQPGTSDANGTLPTLPKDVKQAGMDGLRWRAPEVVSADGRSGVDSVDGHKASVFSLGLVLWEIETGQVPFGELDAVNAQRQSGTGIGPKMESFQDEEFIALIHRCVSVDPELRPTLSEIGEFLPSHPEELNLPTHKEMKDQSQ
ncbi:hypothetical protein BLNAU_2079 [Blattamonas nauphoetae]|uniref:Protein kinase domain-containing protein n=1 Tax=Blattamonas nauphoetae TaxID=2049346 RepID=A0ABQ9YH21_9EUKA|nr:hypothetical protein BLNAU_2079 [Blattamonas nauphoetae]